MEMPSFFINKFFGVSRGVTVGYTDISIINDTKVVEILKLDELIAFPDYKSNNFYSTLFLYKLNTEITINFLKNADILIIKNNIEKALKNHLPQAVKKAIQTFDQLAVNSYLRDSSIELLCQHINVLIHSYLDKKPLWQQTLDSHCLNRLDQIAQYAPIEKNVDKLRGNYENNLLAKRQFFYDKIETNPLTKEQRQAVIRNNDRNLVLAAAGTGKTSVIVAKVLDLIDRKQAKPTDILVLAYNTAAAKELRERLAQRAESAQIAMDQYPSIMTFHALGRMLLQQSDIPIHLSVFVQDSSKLEAWLANWLNARFGNHSEKLFGFIDISKKPHFDGVDSALKCLQAIRTERLDQQGIRARLKAAGISKSKEQAELLWELVQAYCDELLDQEAIDFNDMIIRAIEVTEQQQFKPLWSHLLIDEFQDISGARIELVKTLVKYGPQPCLTAVGDDWQAIYRFAGGKLELTTQFDTLVGSNTKTRLQKTFRYNNSIADLAGRFVMKNPEQFKKQIKTHHIVTQSQVYLLDSRTAQNENEIEVRALQTVATIRKHDPDGMIAVLGRYRYLLNNAQKTIAKNYSENIEYWTFHGAKGLEADYCILLGFFKGKVGFPNQSKGDEMLEALLPTMDSYPHSEERRLFYVALTRARNKVYIIADSAATSEFIEELIAEKYDIHVVSQRFLNKIEPS